MQFQCDHTAVVQGNCTRMTLTTHFGREMITTAIILRGKRLVAMVNRMQNSGKDRSLHVTAAAIGWLAGWL